MPQNWSRTNLFLNHTVIVYYTNSYGLNQIFNLHILLFMLPIRSTVNYSLSLDGMQYNKLGHFNNTKIIVYSFTRTNKGVYFVLKLYLAFCAWFGFDVYKNKKMPKMNPLKLINWVENGFITMKRMCNSGERQWNKQNINNYNRIIINANKDNY